MFRRFLCLVAVALLWSAPARAEPVLNVVTTTAHLADIAAAVGGERIAVESLLGPGVDPHLYKPTRSDIVRLIKADLVLANGLHLEAQFDETFEQISRRRPVVKIGERLPEGRLIATAAFAGRFDPHIWMDPDLWAGAVDAVRDVLIERDPEGRAVYEAGSKTYLEEIGRFAAYAKKATASVPASARILVTAHDAFGYFGRAFGFEVVGIQGLSTESEAGLKRIEDIITFLADRKIGAVFVESSVPQANIRALVEGAKARGHELKIGGELFSDALGAPGTYEGTWLGMLDHNVTAIARALGGTAPERGYQNRLSAGT
jgi:manganese/zinc/iron transport system substrate-binding protein